MTALELENLNYLHDATVLDIKYTMSSDGNRVVVIRSICHDDACYPAWNGKTISVTLEKVKLLEQVLYGYTTEREEISGWDFSIPTSMESEVIKLEKLGINCSGTKFTLSFQSGSYLRGICGQIDVSVDPS